MTAMRTILSDRAGAGHRAPGALAHVLTVTLAVIAIAGAVTLGSDPLVSGGPEVSWVALLASAWLAAAVPIRLRVGRHGIDVTAMDAVVAGGMWVVPPDQLVLAVALGACLQLLLVERQRGHALLLNLAASVLHPVVAVTVLGVLTTVGSGTVALGATLVATVAGSATAAAVVACTAVLEDSDGVLDASAELVAATLTVALATGACGALAADLYLQGRSWWLPLLPLALSLAVSMDDRRERRRAIGLQGAIEASRAVHAASDPGEASRVMVQQIADRLQADAAELLRVPRDGRAPVRCTVGEVDGWDAVFGDQGATAAAATLHLRDTWGWQAGWGMSMAIAVPDGDTVAVRLLRRSTGGRPFTRSDVELFEGMCHATVISFETSQMHEKLASLRELDEMKTSFLTAVSHDLRTPLSVVLGGVLTVAEHADEIEPERRQALLMRVAEQARRLDRVLSDLLDVDRLQRGHLEPDREEVDVTAVVAETVSAIGVDSHPIRLSPARVVGFVDAGHLARVTENLVRNAVKYTPAGTPVWVDVRHSDGATQLVVADAGPGVPDDQRDAIFGAFVRGDDTHHSPGTGVGLDLVRRLAELHGGRAWVDERPGGGARFWVTLPDAAVVSGSSTGPV